MKDFAFINCMQIETCKTENNIGPSTWNSSTEFRNIKHHIIYE